MPKAEARKDSNRPQASSQEPLVEPLAERGSPKPKAHPGADAAREQAVARLERELLNQTRRKYVRFGIWALLLGAVALYFVRARQTEAPPSPLYRTQVLELRDIIERVESTGRIKPLTEVQVGAQVSGRVVKVLVDFNSRVKEGQLLAEIDPQLLGAQVGQVTGQLETAKANLERAYARTRATEIDLARVQGLAKEGLASLAEVDQAKSALDVAKAEALAADATLGGLRSQLNSARTTLAYAKIYSPIDGVVITRSVEPGQTVAANFSAPILFVIAEDLSKMQALADIDEADVGKIAEGMPAKVSVDAFAGESFEGRVTQIRYSPTEVQGVVTYSAVIDVSNPQLKLRPGMTATVSITTNEAKGVLAAPNAALRFKPVDKEQRELGSLQHGQARVYTIAGGPVGAETLDAGIARMGLSDGIWTEIAGDGLTPGKALVTEETDKVETKRRFMGMF
jgi:HlyD family secretion protein